MTTTTRTSSPQAAVADLRHRLPGRAHLPGSPEYAALVVGHNTAALHQPDVVVDAHDVDDVVAAVATAAVHALPVSVLSTGHGALPVVDGVLLRTTRLDTVAVSPDSRTVEVGAGATWGMVLAALRSHDRDVPAGTAASVGAVGATLGGGIGPLSRHLGVASDHVVGLDVVTPDGVLRRVDASTEPDLFRGLRGGRTGLGVVTAMTMAVTVTTPVRGGRLWVAGPDGAGVVERALAASAEAPDWLSLTVRLLRLPDLEAVPPPLRGQHVTEVLHASAGDSRGTDPWLDRVLGGATAVVDERSDGDLLGWIERYGDNAPAGPVWQAGRLLGPLSAEAGEALVAVAGPGSSLPLLGVEVRLLGGRIAQPEPGTPPDTVGGRDAAALLNVIGAPAPELFADAVPAAAEAVFVAMEPWAHGGSQANFHGPVHDRAPLSMAWPPALDADLAALRRRYDPVGLFAADLARSGAPSPGLPAGT